MAEHTETMRKLRDLMQETHARINEDARKVQEHPDYPNMPSMLRAYVDILVIDIELLQKRENNAADHIDALNGMLDRYTALTQ